MRNLNRPMASVLSLGSHLWSDAVMTAAGKLFTVLEVKRLLAIFVTGVEPGIFPLLCSLHTRITVSIT